MKDSRIQAQQIGLDGFLRHVSIAVGKSLPAGSVLTDIGGLQRRPVPLLFK
ncbi:MAG: hypothetical protein AABZ56_07730 [Bacteroidota bacterium]